jgi:hypothetical protein
MPIMCVSPDRLSFESASHRGSAVAVAGARVRSRSTEADRAHRARGRREDERIEHGPERDDDGYKKAGAFAPALL